MSSTAAPRLRVAIVGAGIGGLAAAISLRRIPNIDVQLYERAKELREIGASIALGPNGLRGLEELGVLNALDSNVAFRSSHGVPMQYRHWKTGEIIAEDRHTEAVTSRLHYTARYHRAHLHQALAEHVPPETIHLSKNATKVDLQDVHVVLSFDDGTMADADLLVGADGIHSVVRSTFVPDHRLNFSGWVALRAVFDRSVLDDIQVDGLIPNIANIDDSVHVVGADRNLFWSKMGKGAFTVVGGKQENQADSDLKDVKWDDLVDASLLKDLYKDWNLAAQEVVKRVPEGSVRAFPNYSGDALKQWTWGDRVTVLGDAAHPHGGAFAAGGSLAINDAQALYLALTHALPVDPNAPVSKDVLGEALRLYEATRQPHAERIIAAVKAQKKGATTEPWSEERIAQWAREKKATTWIHEYDVHAAFQEALEA